VIWRSPSFSPDGQRLVFDTEAPDGIWIYEWAREALDRLTGTPGRETRPAWTPDGRRIAFSSPAATGSSNIYWQRIDGSGGTQRLTESQNAQFVGSWHPSGKYLAFSEVALQKGPDLMILSMEGDEAAGWKPGKPTVFLSTPFVETDPMFSPDGRWIAYSSNESGALEVYVRPFPGPGGKTLISNSGGISPVWSPARREVIYQSADQRLMVASYAANGDSFHVEKPRPWSESQSPVVTWAGRRSFALHPDGERIALPAARDAAASRQNTVVFLFNFFDELRRRSPLGKQP